MKESTISIHFVATALQGAKEQGYDIEKLLQAADIPVNLLGEDKARISAEQFTKLLRTLWYTMNDELMGLANKASRFHSFATMCQLVIYCQTLEEALLQSSHFYQLFDGLPFLEVVTEGEEAILRIRSETALRQDNHVVEEFMLTIWHRLACWLIGQRIPLIKASFNYEKPGHVKEYYSLFFCPLEFEQEFSGIHFSAHYLSMPLVRSRQALDLFLRTAPAGILVKPDEGNSYTSQVHSIIGKREALEFPSFESIAQQLHSTPQTLRRRLQKENTSYQEIKDTMRRDIAIYHLSRKKFSINRITFLVGFTETSAFHRAFKKWTGVTPRAYRQELQ